MTTIDPASPQTTLDPPVVAAFAGAVVFGGANPIAIHFSNQALPPLYGAALRFSGAALLVMAFLALRRIRLPKGSSLGGALAFGVLVAGANGLAYYAILHVPAAIAAVFLAAVPLLTMFLAAAHRLESLHVRGAMGGLLAVVGIAVLRNPDFGVEIPLPVLLALIGAVVCATEAGIVVKKWPSHHPAATNGAAMVAGTAVLLMASAVAGEAWLAPSGTETWVALAHLTLLGTVGVFAFYLFVLQRWSASATSYAVVLMPVVAAILGMVLLDQAFTWGMVVAVGLILAGVYVGALSRRKVPIPADPGEEALAQRCASS